jgi:hypothetical protein
MKDMQSVAKCREQTEEQVDQFASLAALLPVNTL